MNSAAYLHSTERRPAVDPVHEVVKELTHVKQWIRSELVERMCTDSLWQAFRMGVRIRLGIEDGTIFAFVDDLHNSNRAYCRELWTALKPLNIKWGLPVHVVPGR